MVNDKVRVALECHPIRVPDLDDIVSGFRTDREPVDDVLAVLGKVADHCGNGIAHKAGAGSCLEDADGVGSAIDILTVLPERGDAISHEEEHAVG